MFGRRMGFPDLLIILLIVVLPPVVSGQIFYQAGYSGWLGLLVVIPLANFTTILCSYCPSGHWKTRLRVSGRMYTNCGARHKALAVAIEHSLPKSRCVFDVALPKA